MRRNARAVAFEQAAQLKDRIADLSLLPDRTYVAEQVSSYATIEDIGPH